MYLYLLKQSLHMHRLLLPIVLMISACSSKSIDSLPEEDLQVIYYLDTLEAQIAEAKKIARQYNPERMKTILAELEVYYQHFKTSPRQYSREFFIYDLSGLEDTRRTLTKSLPEYQKIIHELDFNEKQIKALKNMIRSADSLNDTLRMYIDHESIAMQETMTKFYKRIRNPLNYKDKWPELKRRLDSAMQYDLQNPLP
ncbi:hypothetical protein AT05_07310 [Schleiferia thermophila str. Yellowstone]|jgi:F0F1-type ATP synthase gamma subunit|nr:hypothetical protein AT05_07310 [Schleiferia thermophila str. Yellowstone]